MRHRAIPVAGVLVACILPAAAAYAAEAGILKPVACDPADGPPLPSIYIGATMDKAPGTDAGIGPKAKVGTAASGGLTVAMAADFRDGDADADVIHLDFAGQGKFDAKKGIRLVKQYSSRTDYYQATFGPAKATVVRDGKTFPLCVRGRYYCYKTRHRAYLVVTAAVAGKCSFGGKLVDVRFMDCTGNFRFGDEPTSQSRGGTRPNGDMMLIGGVKVVCGQPVEVDGKWYKVSVSADGAKATAERTEVSAGKLAGSAGRWEAALAGGDNKALMVSGGRDPVAVPAGTYRLMYYQEFSAPDASGGRATVLSGLSEYSRGKSPTITIAAGETARLDVGSPLTATLTASARGGTVRLGMGRPVLVGGVSVVSMTRHGGWVFTKPACPKLRITDEAGKVVDSVILEYG